MPSVKTIPYKGYTIEVEHDNCAENPRDTCDCITHMVCFHGRYNLGDKHDYSERDFSGWDAMEAQLCKDFDIFIIDRLYLHDHSGISISNKPFDSWDSGCVGFIFITKPEVLKVWEVQKITKKITKEARNWMESELKEYDDYLSGSVFCYSVYDKNGGAFIPDGHTGGWFGLEQIEDDSEMIKEAKGMVDEIAARDYPVTNGKGEIRVCSKCHNTFWCNVLHNRPTLPTFKPERELCRVCLGTVKPISGPEVALQYEGVTL